VQIAFLIGERRHLLGADDARWLEQRIRATCIDGSDRPVDADALPCLQLADRLATDLEHGTSESIELAPAHIRGLTEHVLEPSGGREREMEALYLALRSFRAESDL
jgi:hypothetical protein